MRITNVFKGAGRRLAISAITVMVAFVAMPGASAFATASTVATTGISGLVTAAAGGTPVAGICVMAFPAGGGAVPPQATTAADGRYGITGMTAGNYTVQFSAGCGSGNYVRQDYPSPVTVTAGQTTPNINAAMVAAGTITGTVTAAASGALLSGICVSAIPAGGGPFAMGPSTQSSPSGTYSLSGVAAGDYTVRFARGCGNSGNYLTQDYPGAVHVTAGATTPNINAAMVAGGTITGTVTAAAGGGVLAGICVSAFPASGGGTFAPPGTATTAGDGTYVLTGLATGSYTVEFATGCGNNGNFIAQNYANPVSVTAGATTPSINAAMVAGGTITGTVTAASGGTPLAGICVSAVRASGGPLTAPATTAVDGTYSFPGLATGSYTVRFTTGCGNNGNFIAQNYANPVSVTAGATTPNINASMVAGGTITGTVRAAAGATPLAGICVFAFPASGGPSTSPSITAGDGNYSIIGLATGSYTVQFSASYCGNTGNYASQDFPTPVSVTAGQTTPNIDAAMAAGGTISGTVRALNGLTPLAGICVFAFPAAGGQFSPTITTAADGTYSITGLASGSYTVEFSASYCGNTGNYVTQVYPTPVAVTAGQTTAHIDAAMEAGGTITGTVTAATAGSNLPGICVSAYPHGGSPNGSLAVTGPTGAYSLTGLAPGSDTVEFDTGCGSSGYDTQFFSNKTSAAASDPVTVTANQTSMNINAAMITSTTATPVPPHFTADTPPVSGAVNAAYTYTFIATGTPAPTFSVATGSLPAGLTLDHVTEVLSGTPSAIGVSTFTVTAANGAAPDATSPTLTITVVAGVPSAPVGPTAAAGNGQATVSWTAPVSNGGSPVTGYTVTSSPGGQTCTWTAGPLTCVVVGLTNATSYTFTVVATNAVGAGAASAPSNAVVPVTPGVGFHSLTPARIVDSRPDGPNLGPYSTPWGAGVGRDVTVSPATSVPAGVDAVVVNLTVTNTTGIGYLTVWPAGQPQPLAANLVWTPGQTISNAVTVKVGTAGKVSIFNSAGNTDVVIDTAGYYDAIAGDGFTSLTPARILDSRPAGPNVGPYSTPWAAGVTRDVTVSPAGGVPAGTDAVVVNLSVTNTTGIGYLTVWPKGQPQPLAANLVWTPGQTISNAVTVKAGTGGQVSVFNSAGNVDVIFDVVGSFAPGTGHLFHPLSPVRIQDSRPAGPPAGAYTTPWGPGVTRDVAIGGVGGVPAAADAVIMNLTVTNTTGVGYLTMWPAGQSQPLAASLTWTPGQTITNAVTVKAGTGAKASIFNSGGNVDVIADTGGYYYQ